MIRALIALAALAASDWALAYMGPGAGLGMLGSLVAVIAAVALAALGLLLLPLRMILKRRRRTLGPPAES
jgi:nitrate reductase gamma subunit